MRPDQVERLKELSEKLAEVVLQEADPDEWPGAGMPLASLSQQQRGDRYWCKKNAAASFSLLERSHSLLSDVQDPHRNRTPDEDADIDRQIAQKEKEAAKVLESVMSKAKQASHGKQQP